MLSCDAFDVIGLLWIARSHYGIYSVYNANTCTPRLYWILSNIITLSGTGSSKICFTLSCIIYFIICIGIVEKATCIFLYESGQSRLNCYISYEQCKLLRILPYCNGSCFSHVPSSCLDQLGGSSQEWIKLAGSRPLLDQFPHVRGLKGPLFQIHSVI